MRPLSVKYYGKLWPNGEFGTSRQREVSLLDGESHVETQKYDEFNQAALKVHGLEATQKFNATRKKIDSDTGLSLVQNSPKGFKKGLKGISTPGKKVVRCAADWLAERYGNRKLSFGTVTVPRVNAEQLAVLVENWSEITRLFLRDLGRCLQSRELPAHVVNVTELQVERGVRTGLPAPHLHFVFVGRRSVREDWALKHDVVRELWAKQMHKYLGENVDCSATENVVGVKHCASGYLGKYMSKGAGICKALIEQGLQHFIPATWWNCTAVLKNKVKTAILNNPAVAGWLQSLADAGHKDLFAFLRPVMLTRNDGSQYQIGWCGRIAKKWLAILYIQALEITLDWRDKIGASRQSDIAQIKNGLREWFGNEARCFRNSDYSDSVHGLPIPKST